jgi:SAM-dependent methyltransferase
MKRVPEPELMLDPEQTAAYARADFALGHQAIVDDLARRFPELSEAGLALDLGCGPLDVTFRLLEKFPGLTVHGVDGSRPMLQLAQDELRRRGFEDRVNLFEQCLPDLTLPASVYPLIFSSSLLHHLHEPNDLWQVVRTFGGPGTRVFIADLYRPESCEAAEAIVEKSAPDEPDVLKQDFLNSLLAAFTPEEVRAQLAHAGLSERLRVDSLTERHMLISGIL